MRWAIVKSSLSTIRTTVGSYACAAMTASSSDASGSRLPQKDLAPWRTSSPLCPARKSRLCGSCSARVLVSAKWREQLLLKLWRRMAGGIRLTRRHPNWVQATYQYCSEKHLPVSVGIRCPLQPSVFLAYSDAMRADKALRASVGSG